jgi:hypothetical protein
MTVNRTTLLNLPLPVTGTESGTWGDTTNNGLTQYLDIAVAGMTSLTSANFTTGALTLSNTTGDSSASNIAASSAQYATIRVSSLAQDSTITAPSSNRSFRVINADSTYTLTIKASGQTGVIFRPGQSGVVAYNGTDYVFVGVVLNQAQTFTAAQTFAGTSSNLGLILQNADEVCTVSATAATGTINYDVTTQNVLYYTSNASANWTVNFRGSSGTSLNTLMSTGQVLTATFLVTQGSTAYYNSAVTIDGSSVTPKYQGGTAWTSGNASGVDAYVYAIVKTASATFTVFASQTRFA